MILRRTLPILVFLISIQFAFSQDTIRTNTSDKPFENIKAKSEMTVSERIDAAFKPIVDRLGSLLFWDPFAAMGLHDPVVYDEQGQPVLDIHGNPVRSSIPLVVVWLIFGAITFTVVMKFVNFRGFKHAVQLTTGIFDDPNGPGEVSHFQALTTALSATVGLGNIAGVAVAISIGGPGATFWIIVAGLLGMSSKFTECTLGVKYRHIDENGVVSGGPMYYLRDGLKKKGLKWLGWFLSGLFALLVIGGSFGGGNMFQANQSFSQLTYIIPSLQDYGAWYGVILAILVGIVIIGGIKSIAQITDKIVPFMALLYVGTSIFIILFNITHTMDALRLIYEGAFGSDALKGGLVGVLIVGFQRAAFSNEAGVGSAAIAHSAVKTERPVSEGFVSLLEPFIDTVVICTMTALVLVFTGTYENPLGLEGSQLTSEAYGKIISWFPYVLLVAIFLFAFSTMISWSYYGLNGFNYLFGDIFLKVFKNKNASKYTYFVIFLIFIVIGSSSSLGSVIDFSDMMILSMAFPNILGLLILAPEVRQEMNVYFDDLKNGKIKRYK